MWAPEEGRGAVGGGWWGRPEGEVTVEARLEGGAGGNEEDLGGLEVELFYEDDLEFQIASY